MHRKVCGIKDEAECGDNTGEKKPDFGEKLPAIPDMEE